MVHMQRAHRIFANHFGDKGYGTLQQSSRQGTTWIEHTAEKFKAFIILASIIKLETATAAAM